MRKETEMLVSLEEHLFSLDMVPSSQFVAEMMDLYAVVFGVSVTKQELKHREKVVPFLNWVATQPISKFWQMFHYLFHPPFLESSFVMMGIPKVGHNDELPSGSITWSIDAENEGEFVLEANFTGKFDSASQIRLCIPSIVPELKLINNELTNEGLLIKARFVKSPEELFVLFVDQRSKR